MGLAERDIGKGRDRAAVAKPFPLPDGFHAIPWQDADLASIEAHWLALAKRASFPNPFFEAWFLIPSLEALDPRGRVMLAMLIADGELRGLTPLQRSDHHHNRKLTNLSSWTHHNAFCATPLVEREFEDQYWAAILDWCDDHAEGALFLHLPLQCATTSLAAALERACGKAERKLRTVKRQERALLESGQSPESYLASSLTTKKRKELRRQRKRLDELGRVEIVKTRGLGDAQDWCQSFLDLEASGWKGKAGSALSSHSETEVLFRTVIHRAAELGQLERLTLTLDGRPVAMLATFLSGRGAYSFKTAFDEDLARFSPGVQLQLANLEQLSDPGLDWCDSCAAQDHAMIDHIWRERREILWQSVAIGRGPRRFAGAIWTGLEAWWWSRRS